MYIPDAKYLYRYEDHYGVISLNTYPVIKKTKCGWRITLNCNTTKFVLANTLKKFAAPTKEIALNSYIQRKALQLKHLNTKVYVANECYIAAKQLTVEQLGLSYDTHTFKDI